MNTVHSSNGETTESEAVKVLLKKLPIFVALSLIFAVVSIYANVSPVKDAAMLGVVFSTLMCVHIIGSVSLVKVFAHLKEKKTVQRTTVV